MTAFILHIGTGIHRSKKKQKSVLVCHRRNINTQPKEENSEMIAATLLLKRFYRALYGVIPCHLSC